MCHILYYTDFVGQSVYGGSPEAEKGSIGETLFDNGVRMGSWGLFLSSVTGRMHTFRVFFYIPV